MSRRYAALFAATAPASAEQRIRFNKVAVRSGDINLTRVAGGKTLTFRLNRAVDQVCGRGATSASMSIRRQVQACREQAIDVAVAAIDAPLLTALYEGGEGSRFARL